MDYSLLQKSYDIFKVGCTYEVIQAFNDYRNISYSVGDKFIFIGSNFVPYESGLSLFLDKNGCEWHLMLCIRPEFQQEVAHNLDKYFRRL